MKKAGVAIIAFVLLLAGLEGVASANAICQDVWTGGETVTVCMPTP